MTKYELFIKQNAYKLVKLSKVTNTSINENKFQMKYINDILLGKKQIQINLSSSENLNKNDLQNNNIKSSESERDNFEIAIKNFYSMTNDIIKNEKNNKELELKEIEELKKLDKLEKKKVLIDLSTAYDLYKKLESNYLEVDNYIEYLKKFWDFDIGLKLKTNKSYVSYLEKLECILLSYYIKSKPMIDVKIMYNNLFSQFYYIKSSIENKIKGDNEEDDIQQDIQLLILFEKYWTDSLENISKINHDYNDNNINSSLELKTIMENSKQIKLNIGNKNIKPHQALIEYIMLLEFLIYIYIDYFSNEIEDTINSERSKNKL